MRLLALVPGGGVEPPRAEARRILSVTPDFCKSYRSSIFCNLDLKVSRDWCSSDQSCMGLLRTLCAHLQTCGSSPSQCNSSQSCGAAHYPLTQSRSEGISVLDDESVLVKLSWADSRKAGELLTRSVDHVKIAIGTVVPSQPDIGARSLCVGSVDLKNRRKRDEPGECVVSFQSAEHNREVAVGKRQAKTVPLRARTER